MMKTNRVSFNIGCPTNTNGPDVGAAVYIDGHPIHHVTKVGHTEIGPHQMIEVTLTFRACLGDRPRNVLEMG